VFVGVESLAECMEGLRSMMICLEGIDAAGKTTQSDRLADALDARVFSFPVYDTPTGKLIKGHLLRYWQALPAAGTTDVTPSDGAVRRLNAEIFQALQLVNRVEVLEELSAAISTGHVILNRYWPSGYAYGRADRLDGERVIKLHKWLPQPDVFVLLDVPAEASFNRRPLDRDRYEEDGCFLECVASCYRELWESRAELVHPRWAIVDGVAPEDMVTQAILKILKEVAP